MGSWVAVWRKGGRSSEQKGWKKGFAFGWVWPSACVCGCGRVYVSLVSLSVGVYLSVAFCVYMCAFGYMIVVRCVCVCACAYVCRIMCCFINLCVYSCAHVFPLPLSSTVISSHCFREDWGNAHPLYFTKRYMSSSTSVG